MWNAVLRQLTNVSHQTKPSDKALMVLKVFKMCFKISPPMNLSYFNSSWFLKELTKTRNFEFGSFIFIPKRLRSAFPLHPHREIAQSPKTKPRQRKHYGNYKLFDQTIISNIQITLVDLSCNSSATSENGIFQSN